jgi:hypothetical protein
MNWLWQQWDEQDRQWKHLFQSKDPSDRALLFGSTYVSIGDGKTTPFWEARWLNRTAPKDLAPGLHIISRCKYRSVFCELNNSNWIRNFKEPLTPELLEEFILIYMALSTTSLTNQRDTII